MKLFAKTFNGASPLTIFAKSFILHVWQSFEYRSECFEKIREIQWRAPVMNSNFTKKGILYSCRNCTILPNLSKIFFFIKHTLETISTISRCSSKENLTYMQNVFTGSNKDMKNRLFWHLYIQLWTVFILWTHKSESIHRIQKIFWTAI